MDFEISIASNARIEKRLVNKTSVKVHKFVLLILGGAMHLIATRYFFVEGIWEWHLESPFRFIEIIIDDPLYFRRQL